LYFVPFLYRDKKVVGVFVRCVRRFNTITKTDGSSCRNVRTNHNKHVDFKSYILEYSFW
jgi:hypothetical protein